MSATRSLTICGAVLIALALIAPPGCTQETKSTSPSPVPTVVVTKKPPSLREESEGLDSLDPCAMRLHDLCEPLLFYYAQKHHLPATLSELQTLPGFEKTPITCPVSNLPYEYSADGKVLTGSPDSKVILSDATPVHNGKRWSIAIVEPASRGDAPLITKTVLLPESFFTTPTK